MGHTGDGFALSSFPPWTWDHTISVEACVLWSRNLVRAFFTCSYRGKEVLPKSSLRAHSLELGSVGATIGSSLVILLEQTKKPTSK